MHHHTRDTQKSTINLIYDRGGPYVERMALQMHEFLWFLSTRFQHPSQKHIPSLGQAEFLFLRFASKEHLVAIGLVNH